MEQVVLNVEGMSCQHCKMAVEKSLQNLFGVTKAEVDLVAKTVKISYETEKVSLNDFEMAITDAGYEVVK
ncbi:MAG: copper ion binding protein [Syntrophomonadaceae bacterium]|mgnify:CR=1 FL=1|jgi:copper chaperone|nr:copper ion binding protein [Syntrophomonadaceae bacterium]MDD3271127.1 copper ion binding protein [Syntrophomonadaceae bacterium]MDD3898606.1 copper ion binding protein [Syntrophomonadaceae bacterium]MDD4562561.1 copper ion binding protein [Syntrophomonadaceae bacterium]